MLRTVEIIGGGLAGLSLGLGLRARGIPVRLIESGSYPRHRVCGEFITGLDEQTSSRLQLRELLKPARPARSVTWCEPGRPDMRHHFPHPALCLSRFNLDAKMQYHIDYPHHCLNDEPNYITSQFNLSQLVDFLTWSRKSN